MNCVDDPPVAANDAVTINEDASATTIVVLANDPDLDGGLKAITPVQNPSANGGTVLITNGGADLTYQPAADYCNAPPGTTPDTFTYILSPGGSIATVSVTVSCVNDAPLIANLAGDTLAYTQGDPATPIDQGGNAAATDVDSPDFDTGTLTCRSPAASSLGKMRPVSATRVRVSTRSGSPAPMSRSIPAAVPSSSAA